MNPIYRFQLSAENDTRQASPVYKDDLAIDYALEPGQQFYRGKLSGKLTFQKDDYLFIRSKAFDTQFDVVISISYDCGQTWAVYWSGQFWKTDCQFNEDDQTAIVTPNVNDRYNAVLAGMEKEYNLIDLSPVIQPVNFDKRPMIQVYVPGESVIGCFLSGMWWEQECEPESDAEKLVNQFHFALNKTQRVIDVLKKGSLEIPDVFTGPAEVQTNEYEFTNGAYKFKYVVGAGSYSWQIVRVSDETILWFTNQSTVPAIPYELTLGPNTDAGVSGNVKIYIRDFQVYARYVLDVLEIGSLQTYEIPADDIVENNRNYHRVIGYNFSDSISISSRVSTTPTKWGLYQPGLYYQPPYSIYGAEFFPIARNSWGRVSIWFSFFIFDWIVEESARQSFTLRDAYPIWSVISVLLEKIAPGITHDGTTNFSEFLYDINPITQIDQRLFITPKSNIIAAGYDQPAQKAPITLKTIMDMLRDCFRCYWFIDEQNRFRIEHISYFMRGGTYTGQPVVGVDLTKQVVTRNGKPWSYARNQYEFDKPEMAARYQFGWMDDVTELFDGFPIDIISKYVNPDNIEQINVANFTSDIDYILLNPGEISKDGFVLLGAKLGINKSKTVSATPGTNYLNEIKTDIPARTQIIVNVTGDTVTVGGGFWVRVNGRDYTAVGIGGTATISNIDVPITSIALSRGGGQVIASGAVTMALNIQAYKLPYVNFQHNNSDHILQNAWVSFMFLQRYYAFDMPARNYRINGVDLIAAGIKKLKTQTIKFPVYTDPNFTELVKTELGNGTIQKMSVNLSSRNANTTLKYDTE